MPRILTLLTCLLVTSSLYANTLQQMEKFLNTANYAAAVNTGNSLLKQHPGNTQVQFMTALALQKNNQPKQAITHYKSIIKTHPDLPEPRNNLAIIYLQQGQYDQAVDLLIGSLKTHPAYATAWQNLNNIYQGLASEAYRKALSENNETSSVLHKIQLTALDKLHQPPLQNLYQPKAEVQLAAIEKTTPPQPIAPAPKQTEDKVIKQATAVDPEPLIQLIKNWGKDWSNQQFEQYKNAYTETYTGRYNSHQEWVDQRRKRIVRPDKILITLSDINVKSLTDEKAVIDFNQSYKSSTYQDRVAKRIHLIKIGNKWKISREVTRAVL